jgi:hypothetical protein
MRTYWEGNWTSWTIKPRFESSQKGLVSSVSIDDLQNGIISFTSSNVPSGLPDISYGGGCMLFTNRAKSESLSNFDKQYVITNKYIANRTYFQGTWNNWTITYIDNNRGKIITCGAGKDYTRLRDAVEKGNELGCTVIVYPGTYDLVSEFSNDISSTMDVTGLGLGNGIHLVFMDGAKVTALFTNDDSEYDAATWERIYMWFNPIYPKLINGNCDYTIENLNIECSNTRYCVHDELYGNNTYIHKYINCRMKYANNHSDIMYASCIGGGLGEHGTIVIEGGIFQSVPNYGFPSTGNDPNTAQICISYHNGDNNNADSSITIKNVYLKDRGYFNFGCYGNSTTKSQITISGCSTGLPTLKRMTTAQSTVDNYELTEWNEDLRISSHWVVDGSTAILVED